MGNEFLDTLFREQTGYVYAPVKDPYWTQHFFKWPQDREQLERHIDNNAKRDVYLSPVLFNAPKVAPETFKGTHHLWTEFDGVVPKDAPEPTMRVLSSVAGHEHWYWELDEFATSKIVVEDLNRRIAFKYEADPSAWDYQQVLRPPNTFNHKKGNSLPVTLIERNQQRLYTLDEFSWIPNPPPGTLVDIKLDKLLPKDLILAKYRWTPDALDLLFKQIEKGRRSDALARLTHECLELGLSNEETYVLLEDRDSVWGKFVGRDDRQRRLEDLIASIRSRKSFVAEIVHGAPEVYRFHDFMQTDIQLKWAIEGLLPVAGSMVIFGKPGIGKSTFSLRLAMDLSLGKEQFLAWSIKTKQKTLFISLEMQHYEVKEFFNDMNLTEDEQRALQEQFYIWPIGNPYPFDTPDQQLELIKHIKTHKIECIIIDSLSIAMYGSVKDDDAIKRLNSFLNEDVRRDLKCSYIFIHHPRKRGLNNEKTDDDQDDAFGSTYINANAQTVVVLSSQKGSPKIHVKLLKTRMSKGMRDFEIERTPDRGFKLVGSGDVKPIDGPEAPKQEAKNGSLGKLFGL